MGKRKRRKQAVPAIPGVEADEAREIAALRAAIAPLVARGMRVQRIASAAGAHPLDMQGFLDGRVSLTWELRERLRQQLPGLESELDPNRIF